MMPLSRVFKASFWMGAVFFSVLCADLSFSVEAAKLVASNYSDRYHISTCKIAQKIDLRDLVTFATPEDAWAAELMPCKKCNPPVPKGKETSNKANFSSTNSPGDEPEPEA